ncbi:SCP2 sterol-binding domain-containing protein [Venenivibrio stagnispumantis]|uniref:Sterol carrier protein n=1 Tax=Venenivibrio stagnispumantis TaxID=407998 RepID=A0AA45WK08_9AQUI|nr:SCP2 sterol-binding domain-containing protein [Venenivibrio stagnispumantis]MCW4572950.1 SCP2 sterol-binding domain-containing protein [Venenivibrio stagnispumantis]SMP04933.1 Putative sterol carrier protein [Venenivibrio stagnispumantis]
MAKFLTEEWINLYKEEWNKNEKLKNDLKNFSASIKYYIDGNENEAVFLKVENGVATEAGKADNNSKYDFEMWATYKDWQTLAKGEMGPKAAMLTKKLKFKGSMITAMKYMGPFEESLRMMGKIPTEW